MLDLSEGINGLKEGTVSVKNFIVKFLNQIKGSSVELIPFQEIKDGFIINNDGKVILPLKINGVFESIMTQEESNAVMVKFIEFLELVLNQRVSFYVATRTTNLKNYVDSFEEKCGNTGLTNRSKKILNKMSKFKIEKITTNYIIRKKVQIMTFAFKPEDIKLKSTGIIYSNKVKKVYFTNEQWKIIKEQINASLSNTLSFLSTTNWGISRLSNEELISIFKNEIDVPNKELKEEPVQLPII